MASDRIWTFTVMDSNQIISLLSGIEGPVFPRNAEFGAYFILYGDKGPRLFQRNKTTLGKAGQPWENINIIVSSSEEHIYWPEMRRYVESHGKIKPKWTVKR